MLTTKFLEEMRNRGGFAISTLGSTMFRSVKKFRSYEVENGEMVLLTGKERFKNESVQELSKSLLQLLPL